MGKNGAVLFPAVGKNPLHGSTCSDGQSGSILDERAAQRILYTECRRMLMFAQTFMK